MFRWSCLIVSLERELTVRFKIIFKVLAAGWLELSRSHGFSGNSVSQLASKSRGTMLLKGLVAFMLYYTADSLRSKPP